MQFIYQAVLTEDPDDGFLVTFPDVPEAVTHGQTREEALSSGAEALGMALRYLAKDGSDIPMPGPVTRPEFAISVPAEDALKAAVIAAFRRSGISKTELAARLGKVESEARRILDPGHPSKLGALQAALAALGQKIVISVEAA